MPTSSTVQTAEARKSLQRTDYFRSLTPDQVRELYMIFVRVDKSKSGFVSMPEYVYFLNKGKKADPTGFLAKVVQFFSKSVDESRLQGYKSFKAILELLLPAISPEDVEEMLAKISKVKAKKVTKHQKKLQTTAGKALIGKRGLEMMKDSDDESEQFEDDQKTEIALSYAMEYHDIFNKWARGKTSMTPDEFYANTQSASDVMELDERQDFYAKYVRRSRIARNLKTDRKDFHSQKYETDFPTFLTMTLPRGFKMPELPDSEKHVAAKDQLWSMMYTKEVAKEETHDPELEKKMKKKLFVLPTLEKNDKAGRALPEKIYAAGEVQECRQLMQHEAVRTVVQRAVADMEEEELNVTPTRRLSLGAVNAQTWELLQKLGKK